MKVPGSKIVPCQGVLGSNHSLTFGLFTQVSGSGPLGPLVPSLYKRPMNTGRGLCIALQYYCILFLSALSESTCYRHINKFH